MIIFSYKAYLVKVMTKGEGGGQKSRKIDDVFYEWSICIQINNEM